MPGGSTFSLTGLRLPFSTTPRQRNGGTAGTNSLLGTWQQDSSYDAAGKRRRPPRWKVRLTVRRVAHIMLGTTLFALWLFWRTYEMHIEIQLYSRGWISRSIQSLPPLSPTCFQPITISNSAYNTTISQSPKHVNFHAGLGLRNGDDCFDFAGTIPQHPLPNMVIPQHTIFHTYWRADLLPLGKRHVSLLHSLLAMQDRETSSVILWTNADVAAHVRNSHLLTEIRNLYGDRFSVQDIDKRSLARGTPMANSPLLDLADKKAWLDGDLVRILVLWARGGVWVDMDTIMTGRDIRPLLESEWVTQWDCYDKVYQPLNGAMMHFFQHSPFLCEMLYAMSNDPIPRQSTTDWGSILYHKVWRRLVANGITPFKILPYCFSDGRNCKLDNRLPDPFAKRDSTWGSGRSGKLRKKVENVWAIHLHNQWEKEFPAKGWVKTMVLTRVSKAVQSYRQSVGKTNPRP